ncbi:TetR/AcrR family transcriptional regulator [Paraburkholderia sp. Tr-20389]|uniref:TetR/AcrR family transcriptional regulator n=1 Tax=Paraburkholderia sp. Tr-20389 TaxID=2703903 RepID=UPI00197F8D80|nr:TetR/AcrR family transcriptional regulator [Paraburkholderia sp. Tr-20389]MBN3754824.1 TetR/AcrR family transcriptional regulator [Paraburkholderia sp. Tr-20389]
MTDTTDSRRAPAAKAETAGARGRPREFDTDAVLAAASKVFWRQGFHATSVDDLCNATGVLRGSLYGVFGDKHGIMMAALDHYAESAVNGLVERLNANVPPEVALRNALLHHTRVTSSLTGCFITNSTLELLPEDELLHAKIRAIQRRVVTLLAAAVIRGQAAGVFNGDLDEKAVADFLLCVTQGLRVLGKCKRKEDELKAVVDVAMRALT